jgi:two-component system response regulator RegX3
VTAVLVVDDEAGIRDSVGFALRQEGYDVDTAADAREAIRAVAAREYDAVVLDLVMPGTSGFDVCRAIRHETPAPIVILSARGSETDRVAGLELGADDYVVKPFSLAELVSRVRAVLRRVELDASRRRVIRLGGVVVDPERHEVVVDGRRVDLTVSEFRLLLLLASAPGRAFSRTELMQHLWQSEHTGGERACDMHVANLRQKLERVPATPERLLTVRGVGYKLVAV